MEVFIASAAAAAGVCMTFAKMTINFRCIIIENIEANVTGEPLESLKDIFMAICEPIAFGKFNFDEFQGTIARLL